jgi:hypothetical protein
MKNSTEKAGSGFKLETFGLLVSIAATEPLSSAEIQHLSVEFFIKWMDMRLQHFLNKGFKKAWIWFDSQSAN